MFTYLVVVGLLVITLILLVRTYIKLGSMRRLLEEEKHKHQKTENELVLFKKHVNEDSLKDSLTGLPERELFEDRLSIALKQSARYQMICSVMALNVDEFRIVNGAMGVDAGDQLLKQIAIRLQNDIRQVDTVCRFGGDQFLFLFPRLQKPETAAYIARRLQETFVQPFYINEQMVYLTACIGITIFPTDGNEVKTLLKNADVALYQAKAHGHNTFRFYRQEMQQVSRRELALESGLRDERVYHDFSIYYLPQIHLEEHKIVCMQALLKWQHPEFGLVTFDEFNRLAEKTGKTSQVGEWMVQTACHHLLVWREKGFFKGPVAIPLSLGQLENMNFVHHVSAILQECHLNPVDIVFSVTDTSLSVKTDMIGKMLRMMKHLGLRLSINSFGVNALPMQYLRTLPVDIFCIDKTLVRELTTSHDSEALVKMIIALANSFGSGVVAEGVETAEQKTLLLNLGCQVMQGNFFGEPLLPHQFTQGAAKEIVGSA